MVCWYLQQKNHQWTKELGSSSDPGSATQARAWDQQKKKMVFRGEEMWKLSFLQVSIQKFLSDWITWASNVAFSHCTASAFYSSTDPKQWGQKRGLKNKAPKACSCLFARIHRGMSSTREDSHIHHPALSMWQKARPGLAMGVSWYPYLQTNSLLNHVHLSEKSVI